MKDTRRHRRVLCVGPVRLNWEDTHGQSKFATARCIEVSESGMRIECPVPIHAGATIMLNAERIRLSGPAKVKRVVRSHGKYVLGVELAQIVGERTLAMLRESS
jgi:PilZ domain